MIARGHDVFGRELDLEGGDARHGPRRCTDLGGKVGKGREVVAEDRRGVGEAVAGELHAVTRITGETDDYPLFVFDGLSCHAAVAGGPAASSGL